MFSSAEDLLYVEGATLMTFLRNIETKVKYSPFFYHFRSHLKTLREEEKLIKLNNFSLSLNVFIMHQIIKLINFGFDIFLQKL